MDDPTPVQITAKNQNNEDVLVAEVDVSGIKCIDTYADAEVIEDNGLTTITLPCLAKKVQVEVDVPSNPMIILETTKNSGLGTFVSLSSYTKNTTGSAINVSVPNNSSLVYIIEHDASYAMYIRANTTGSSQQVSVANNNYYYVYSSAASSFIQFGYLDDNSSFNPVLVFSDPSIDVTNSTITLFKSHFTLDLPVSS